MSRAKRMSWLWPGVVLAGCAAAPRETAQVPDDFAVSVCFAGTPAGPCEPAWLMVEPDGSLRAALGERGPTSALPAAVRTLSRDELIEVWVLASRVGVLASSPPGQAGADDMLPPAGARVATVYMAANGRRRTVSIPDPQARPELPALAARLRALAWIDRP